jgi:hypothetical protein
VDELPEWVGRIADDEDWSVITRENIREAFCERFEVTSITTDGQYVYASPWGRAHITTTVASALTNLIYDIERRRMMRDELR